MKELAAYAREVLAGLSVTYGDARYVQTRDERIEVKNGEPRSVTYGISRGVGVRVVVDGRWGFFATSALSRRAVARACREAVKIARAGRRVEQPPVALSPLAPVVASYMTPFAEDPFSVPLEDKLSVLFAADKALSGEAAVKVRQSFYEGWERVTAFASTEGATIDQRIIQTGGGISATAVAEGDAQTRSYPHSFRGNFQSTGFEYFRALDLPAHGQRVAAEAAALLAAPVLPEGARTVILDGGQLALQVHESIGHPVELDRVLGMEAAYAGTSFLTLDKLRDGFRYGSPLVNVVADATEPLGLGTFGYDDEGVPAQRVDLIKEGMFAGYITSRETAGTIGRASNGTMRADGWNRIPLIRMTNINLLPGAWRLEDLLADSDGAVFMATNRAWSIDNKRLNFQFGTEIAWDVQGGKLGRMYKNPSYTGITPEFWGSCDAVCSKAYWNMWGTPNCGKGQPGQTARVGHGTAPSRFRNVRVGVVR
jgi:TldD protein